MPKRSPGGGPGPAGEEGRLYAGIAEGLCPNGICVGGKLEHGLSHLDQPKELVQAPEARLLAQSALCRLHDATGRSTRTTGPASPTFIQRRKSGM